MENNNILYQKLLNAYSEKNLNTLFSILENKGDGNCLFLAIEQLDKTYNHTVLRKNVCKKWGEIKTKNPEYYQIIAYY